MADNKWTDFRQTLHRHPELSNQESNTALRIVETFKEFKPDSVLTNLGGTGVAFVFKGKESGPTTLIRCELDALPIKEKNNFSYCSTLNGVSHMCGHDGHMSIVTAVGEILSQRKPINGKVILAFQAAEETGEGAINYLNDPQFASIKLDYAFALHNYPGLALGHVAVKAGPFNCASRGMIIRLQGKTSHAAHPENGISPALAMCKIIEQLNALPSQFLQQTWITIIHASMGEIAFGTAPGDAVVMATLRSETNEDMENLITSATEIAKINAEEHKLTWSIEWQDTFQASINSQDGCDQVVEACHRTQTPFQLLDHPMRWSEDFGQFTTVAKEGAMFVLGSGEKCPQLHNPDYDFPDELIPIGRNLFISLIDQINGLA